MSRNTIEFNSKAVTLRHIAESRLVSGSAPLSRSVPVGRDALSLLFEMASDPTRSSDALRLLQELQVHQVELDLQREELENSEQEMSLELARYKAMFELTPTVCLVITREGRIVEANPAAGCLLEGRHDELTGQTVHELVKQGSHQAWHEMLRKLNAGEQVTGCELVLMAHNRDTITMQFSGSVLADGEVLLFGVVS